jgi:hypothetical protein
MEPHGQLMFECTFYLNKGIGKITLDDKLTVLKDETKLVMRSLIQSAYTAKSYQDRTVKIVVQAFA